MFKQIVTRIFEHQAGRIRWHRNMWAIIGGKWDRRRVNNPVHGEFVQDGRVLVRKPCVLCPCAPGDGFYFDGKWSWVPATECRKCPHHRKSSNGFRFPRCTYQRPVDKPAVAREAFIQLTGMLNEATQKTEDIIRGDHAKKSEE